MFKDDPDFQKIIPIAKDIIAEQREDYYSKFKPILNELKTFALKKHNEQKLEVALFNDCKNGAKGSHDKECLKALDDYQHLKKQVKPPLSYIPNICSQPLPPPLFFLEKLLI